MKSKLGIFIACALLCMGSAFSAYAGGMNGNPPGHGTHGHGGQHGPWGHGGHGSSVSQTQGQGQNQGQGQTQGQGQNQLSNSTSASSNGGNSISSGPVEIENNTNYPRQTQSAYAPGLTVSNGTCLGSSSGGIQGPGFGVSAGSTRMDEDCNRRYNSQWLKGLGYPGAATALMCQDADVNKAMEVAGTPCKKPVLKKAAVGEYTDPYIRRRLGLPPLTDN